MKDPKEIAKEIDKSILDKYDGLDDILESWDGKFYELSRYTYALKGFLMSLNRLTASINRAVSKNDNEIGKLARRHRCSLSPEQRKKCVALMDKFANAKYSPTMRSLFNQKVTIKVKK